MTKPKHDAAALKQAARGRWAEILAALGGVDVGLLDGKNHPCPRCGGMDRFRFTDKDGDGSVFCNQCGKGIGDGIAALQWLRGWTFHEAVNALAEHLGHFPQAAGGSGDGKAGPVNSKPRTVATYNYRDEKGDLLLQVVRFDPKGFKQRQPKPGGGWLWSVKGVRMVPYRLPELLAADPARPVVIVEGEKDADRLASLGIIATTNVGGAGKWRSEYNEHFRGRTVFVIPDNDEVGRKHAETVAWHVNEVARNVRVLYLPGLPDKGDVSDWLDAGHTRDELLALASRRPCGRCRRPRCPKPVQPATQPTEPEPPPFVAFPTDVLPAVARDFIRQGATALGCDESMVALPLLAAPGVSSRQHPTHQAQSDLA